MKVWKVGYVGYVGYGRSMRQHGEKYMLNVLRFHIFWLYICVHVSYCRHFVSGWIEENMVGGSGGSESDLAGGPATATTATTAATLTLHCTLHGSAQHRYL